MTSSEPQQIRFSLGGSFTPVVRTLLWANAVVFAFLFITKLSSPATVAMTVRLLGLVPGEVWNDKMLWQPFTYMFVHIDATHFLFNFLGIWLFGAEVERFLGSRTFWRYYLLTGVGGGLVAVFAQWGSPSVTIGASGAIFGLLVAYGFLFPNRMIYLYMLIPIRAKYLVTLYGIITIVSLLADTSSDVSHLAHFGGMAFGVGWFGFYRGRDGIAMFIRGLRKRRMRRKLRLIQRKAKKDDDGPFPTYSNKTLH
jgi:membrane associated rhomboid family serine protease